ncbi:MAG: HutD family protein [Pseudomonadota bacterium]
MSWTFVLLDSVGAQPWRNGGGITRELLAWPSVEEWTVRISVADVTRAGPFSSFPGVQRWFAVLSGEGVELTVDAAVRRLTPADPAFAFGGDATVECRLLGGATLDLNLMVKSRPARMRRVSGTWSERVGRQALVAVFANASDVSISCDGLTTPLARGMLAWRMVDSQTRIQLSGGDAIWMEVES